jgi:glyoxylase-like metal-dependent hydrolase (beta-lactamase superfamily II)
MQMEIAPGIHQITCAFGTGRMVFVYLLVGDDACMLVDTGCAHNPQQDILPYFTSIGLPLKRLTYILITHSDLDHQGGNEAMAAAAPHATFLCHRLDQPWIDSTEALIAGRYSQFEESDGIGYGEEGKAAIRKDCKSIPVHQLLEGGERFDLGRNFVVETIFTPGHTYGHTAVWDPRSETLISGEASMGNAIPGDDWSPAMPPTYCYVAPYFETQARLLGMPIGLLASAHWKLRRGDEVERFLGRSRDFVLRVNDTLLARARSTGGFTLREAIDAEGPALGEWPAATNIEFAYGMSGSLEYLTAQGLLEQETNEAGHRFWRSA